MKASRRQELKTNDLAAWLEDVRRSFSQWGGYVIGGVALVILVVAINAYMRSARAEARTSAYMDLRRASTLMNESVVKTDDELRSSLATIDELVATSTDDAFKIDALIAKASMAVGLARRGLGNLDKPEARDDVRRYLDEARAAYTQLAGDFRDRSMYHGRAVYGLYQVEALAFVLDGDPAHRENGARHLEQLRDDSALNATPLQTVAIERLNALDDTFTLVQFEKRPAAPLPPVPGPVQLPGAAPSAPGATTTQTIDLGEVKSTQPPPDLGAPVTGGETGEPAARDDAPAPQDDAPAPQDDAPAEPQPTPPGAEPDGEAAGDPGPSEVAPDQDSPDQGAPDQGSPDQGQ